MMESDAIKISCPSIKLTTELLQEGNDVLQDSIDLEVCCYEGGSPTENFYISFNCGEGVEKVYKIKRNLLLDGLRFLDSDAARVLTKELQREAAIKLKNEIEENFDEETFDL